MTKGKFVVKYHPDLDFGLAFFGGDEIPTKQDKFKPLTDFKIVVDPEGKLSELAEEFDLYLKKKGKDNSLKFQEELIQLVKENLPPDAPFETDSLEVCISISMDEKRFKLVDIDNLAKFVIDCMKGYVFVDDMQIVNLYVSKEVNPAIPLNGLIVGVRRIKSQDESWFRHIKLLSITDLPSEGVQ